MRTLNRNKTQFYYATYVSREEIKDEYGNATGQYQITYSSPVSMSANVSAARGDASIDMFGISLDYDKVIVTDDLLCPISETSILWIDRAPETPYVPTAPKHDYTVNGVAESLNSIGYAVRKVNVS